MRIIILALALLLSTASKAQKKMEKSDFYATIPEAPSNFTAGTMVSRMLDGLGFRYYWATEGLISENLNYKPSEKARTTLETMDHVYNLSKVIVDSAQKVATDSSVKEKEMTWKEKRLATLENIKIASAIFKASEDLSSFKIIFSGDKGAREFPFWNQINGPIEDAVWHAGQIVVFRRASGNPMHPKVNMFTGKVRE